MAWPAIRYRSMTAGLAYGDGLFETIAVRDGRCRFLDAHLDRLESGCRRLGIPPPSLELLRAELRELVGNELACHSEAYAYAGGWAPRLSAAGAIASRRVHSASSARGPRQLPPARLRYCSTPVSRNASLAGLKTLNRLEQVLARAEWDDPAIGEGLMRNDRQEVICGTRSNLFYTRAETLCTPQLDESGVHGIMRAQVIDVARAQGIRTIEQAATAADLAAADDLFLTNALVGIWPVAELAGRSYERSGVTRAIMAGLTRLGVTECAE